MAGCLETPDDNDTTAGDHGSRSGVRGVLQWGRILQGIGQSARRSLQIDFEEILTIYINFAVLWETVDKECISGRTGYIRE